MATLPCLSPIQEQPSQHHEKVPAPWTAYEQPAERAEANCITGLDKQKREGDNLSGWCITCRAHDWQQLGSGTQLQMLRLTRARCRLQPFQGCPTRCNPSCCQSCHCTSHRCCPWLSCASLPHRLWNICELSLVSIIWIHICRQPICNIWVTNAGFVTSSCTISKAWLAGEGG